MNGDYKITDLGNADSDLQYIGDANPHFVYGLTVGASWKGIDVSAMFQGVAKQYIMRNDWMAYPFRTIYTNQNPTFLGQTWTEDHKDARYPRLTNNTNRSAWNYQNNDFMLQNSRYIRLKTLVVGYTLPQIWTRKVKLEKVRLYFSVTTFGRLLVFVTVLTRKWVPLPIRADILLPVLGHSDLILLYNQPKI